MNFRNIVILITHKIIVFTNACLGSKIIKKIKEVDSINLRIVVFSYGKEKRLD